MLGPVSILLIIWALLDFPRLCWCVSLQALANEASALAELAIIIFAFLATVWELSAMGLEKGYRVMVIAWGRFQKFRQEQKKQKEREYLLQIDKVVRICFPDLSDEEREQLVLHLRAGGSYPEWESGQANGSGAAPAGT